MASKWIWVGKYLVVILVALIVGAAIGNLALFKIATLGTPRLTAAALAQFIAYVAALGLLWSLGLRVSQELRDTGGSAASVAMPVLALATLIVVPSSYVVLMRFIRPFLSRDLKPFIDWTFIVGTIAAAIWLVWALFANSDAVIEAMGKAAAGRKRPESQRPTNS